MIDFSALKAANAPLNAFVDWDEATTGGQGRLAGLTIGVKANIAVAGLPWTGGLAPFRDRIAERDAATVAALRAAGAAIIGTLNMEEAALGAKTDNPFFGATQNPHRIGFTPGGSSGGSGAAVAAGLCDAALGTDTMGSVRIPAAYCGIYGFKPANDRVSQDGLEVAEASLDCIGPLARSLDVLEAVARVMSDVGGGATGEVIVLADLGGVTLTDPVAGAYATARAAMAAGRAITLPHLLSRVRYAGFVATARALAGHLAGQEPWSAHLSKLLSYGPRRSAADWAEDQRILVDTRAAVHQLLADGTMLLLPTAPQTAFPHAEAAPANQADFTCLANVAGVAAITIPAGVDEAGLPVGVQLLAEPGREAGLFAAARALDAALNAYRRPAYFFTGEFT